jgi:hypothetical protein
VMRAPGRTSSLLRARLSSRDPACHV